MSYFSLQNTTIRTVRKQHSLTKGKIIGRGAFSVVFSHTKNSVMKITCDSGGYYSLSDGVIALEGEHFPKLIKNYGDIGGPKDDYIYMMEIERLAPLSKASKATRKDAEMLVALFRESRQYNAGCKYPLAGGTCWEVLKNITVELEKYREDLTTLYDFVINFNVIMDVTMQNLMVRNAGKDNETLIFNDLVVDKDQLDSLNKWRKAQYAKY